MTFEAKSKLIVAALLLSLGGTNMALAFDPSFNEAAAQLISFVG